MGIFQLNRMANHYKNLLKTIKQNTINFMHAQCVLCVYRHMCMSVVCVANPPTDRHTDQHSSGVQYLVD